MSFPGSLFVLEGPDGVGKTTLVRRIHHHLQERGVDCISAAFPGSEPGSVGHLVHRLHHDPAKYEIAVPAPAALQLLHIAAHVDALHRLILPALREGRIVVLDRFWWSTFVYGRESGIEEDAIRALLHAETYFWQGVTPRAIFLLSRSAAQAEHPSYGGLAERYRELAQSWEDDGHDVHYIGNDGDIEYTLEAICDIIAASLNLRSLEEHKKNEPQLSLWEDSSLPSNRRQTKSAAASPAIVKDAPEIIVWHGSARTTQVFDTYWRFAEERQNIFFRRFAGEPPPWTSDPILLEHKFTNVYRACDRVSQFLIQNVIRSGDHAPDNLFFRIILFKLFNRIDTWRYLESKVGPIRWSEYTFERYDAALNQAMSEGRQIYSAAYIMPSARVFGHERKHSNHLRLIELMMKEELPSRLRDVKSMEEAFSLIRKYHSIGDFLAYQYVTDLNYSDLVDFREDEFVVPGPGARDGIRKCFSDTGGFSDADIIKKVADSQEKEFRRLGITFQTLWDRPLQYIDCQNLFCEVDKYARVYHPDVAGLSGRTRIKQKFNPSPEAIQYIFPKKWNLDERVKQAVPPAVIGRGQISMFWV